MSDSKETKFRVKERHPEIIESALKRFENSLLQKEHERILENEEFKNQIEHNKLYEIMIKDKIQNERKQNRENLKNQMNENKINQLKEKLYKKKHIRTNYGPEETDYSLLKLNQKREMDMKELNKILQTQKKNRQDLENFKQVNEKVEAENSLRINQEIVKGLKEDMLNAKAKNIKSNVKTWNLQSALKNRDL